jgi:hypothetical protein
MTENEIIFEKLQKIKQLSLDIMSHYGYIAGKIEIDTNCKMKSADVSILIITVPKKEIKTKEILKHSI